MQCVNGLWDRVAAAAAEEEEALCSRTLTEDRTKKGLVWMNWNWEFADRNNPNYNSG